VYIELIGVWFSASFGAKRFNIVNMIQFFGQQQLVWVKIDMKHSYKRVSGLFLTFIFAQQRVDVFSQLIISMKINGLCVFMCASTQLYYSGEFNQLRYYVGIIYTRKFVAKLGCTTVRSKLLVLQNIQMANLCPKLHREKFLL
jgi:hypothetical protein